ncbi:hypothetical protein LDENG_00173490, partial [Lucifuga dentata]
VIAPALKDQLWSFKSFKSTFKLKHFACLSLIYSIFIHITGELKMFFLPSRPPLISVHSAIKINLLILERFLG